ncbi:hypothetical protein [Halobacillus sp. A1]|nr:hypothetical protein [Halobacillus sp. A1]
MKNFTPEAVYFNRISQAVQFIKEYQIPSHQQSEGETVTPRT